MAVCTWWFANFDFHFGRPAIVVPLFLSIFVTGNLARRPVKACIGCVFFTQKKIVKKLPALFFLFHGPTPPYRRHTMVTHLTIIIRLLHIRQYKYRNQWSTQYGRMVDGGVLFDNTRSGKKVSARLLTLKTGEKKIGEK